MNNILNLILCDLRHGSTVKAYANKQYVNDLALLYYNKSELNQEDVSDLKDIITICNIIYNDTDKEMMIIEDGFYDLILEKYKKYDPHFQVGAEVLKFKASTNVIETVNVGRPIVNGVTFIEDKEEDKSIFSENILINPTKYIDGRDFFNKGSVLNNEYISKRTHDTESNHPELIGTLNKAKFVLDRDADRLGVLDDSNVATVERDFFAKHIMAGILNPTQYFEVILELKYDGISVEADCTDEIVSARSRGDTGVGKVSDLTPILKGYKFPHRPAGSKMIGVKFEAIITKTDLPYFNRAKGYEYVNCRSAIVGLFSSSDAWKYRDFVTLVPLAVEKSVYENECQCDRVKEIEFLNSNFVSKGCPLRYAIKGGSYIENLAWINLFTQEAESDRELIPFMYDGVVVSYRDESIRRKLGRENYINLWSIAVKFNPLKRYTTFRGYTYTVGKEGTITPMINYDPVEFYGTIHPKSSGHSYARFMELGLRKGDMISVEYVNDVMPYVYKPINDFNIENAKVSPLEQFPTRCPVCGGEIAISSSGKSAKCINPGCIGKQYGRMVDMCTKLGLVGFGDATIAQLGYTHLADMMDELTSNVAGTILYSKGFGPVESENIIDQLNALKTKPLVETVLLGSIGFTGIAIKTFEQILPVINYQKIKSLYNMIDPDGLYKQRCTEFISSIKGIGPAIASTIESQFEFFERDIDWMYEHANIVPYVPVVAKRVVLSGTRDRELVDFLNSHGFRCNPDDAITRNTDFLVIPIDGHSSSKIEKAKKYNIPILTVQEIMSNPSKYSDMNILS